MAKPFAINIPKPIPVEDYDGDFGMVKTIFPLTI